MPTLLLDIDGVLIQAPELWGNRWIREAGLPSDAMEVFFREDFQSCVVGKADLREVITPWLERWHWHNGVDAYLQAWFECENNIVHPWIDLVAELRKQGWYCALATNQEIYRTKYLWNTLRLCDHFDAIHASSSLGFAKPDPRFFTTILDRLPFTPEKVVFLDDKEAFVNVAKTLGITAYQITPEISFETVSGYFGLV